MNRKCHKNKYCRGVICRLYGIIRNPSIGKYKPDETWCPIWSQNNKELKLLSIVVAKT